MIGTDARQVARRRSRSPIHGSRSPIAAHHPLHNEILRRRRRNWVVLTSQILLLIVSLLLWQWLSNSKDSPSWHLIDSYYVSRPTDVWGALVQWWKDGILFPSILETAGVTLLGLAIGLALGLVFGLLFGIARPLSAVLNPFVDALYSIPRLALIPLFLLWFGLGLMSKLALVVSLVGFLVFYNTYSGVRDVDPGLIDTLRVMGAKRRQIYRKVVIPSAMVWIIAGLRVAVPQALVGAVTAEMLMSNRGMGFLVLNSASQFYTQGVFAAILILMFMAMILSGAITLFERIVLRWRREK